MRIPASELKVWLWLRQNGQCFLCEEPIDITIPVNRYGAPSTEHLIPRNSGGKERRSNLALTHWECNKKRGPNKWLKQVRPPQRLQFDSTATPTEIV